VCVSEEGKERKGKERKGKERKGKETHVHEWRKKTTFVGLEPTP
jgi:hypothetical protein